MELIGNYIVEFFYVIYIIIVVSTIFVVVMENRNPVKTMAWIMVLIFLPILGMIIYFLFGQKWYKKHIISKRSYNKISKESISDEPKNVSVQVPPEYVGLSNLFRKTDEARPRKYNTVSTYYCGYDFITAMLKAINRAKNHIHIEFYIFMEDATGHIVRDALIDKAHEGVKIRIIIDDLGSWHTKEKFLNEMRKEGIEIVRFLPVKLPLISNKINYRNHRKLIVIDGKTGFVGGMNIADRYIKGVKWGTWRDTQIKVEGYAVHEYQTIFLLDWFFATKQFIKDKYYFPKCSTEGTAIVQTVTSAPFSNWRRIMQGLVLAITRAKSYFYIQTPYFMPTEPIICAMQTAALSGVDVRLIIPEHSDSNMTHLATRSYLKDVLKAGVKVYMYTAGFVHSKMMVSDDMLSIVGSTNMDFRSFEQNFEINSFIYDQETAIDLKQQYMTDIKNCKRITMHKWQKRPMYVKFLESFVRIFSPLL